MQVAMKPSRAAVVARPSPYHPDLECLEERTLLDASFKGLGFLPGGSYSDAWSVSADGSVVVGRSGSPAGSQAFRWTDDTGMVQISNFGGIARGVSADGHTVGGETGLREGFRWTQETGEVLLGYLHSGDTESPGEAISEDGHAIVGFSGPDGYMYEAYRWTAETGMIGLGFLYGNSSRSNALGVSADGQVVVGESISTETRAFRWTAETGMVDLGELPGAGPDAYASAVSADGHVIIGVAGGGSPFRWTEATGMVPLGSIPGTTYATPEAVSGNGSVAVGDYATPDGHFHAALWDNVHGGRDLQDALITDFGLGVQLNGWQLIEALGISPDGRNIVGTGDNPAGQVESWLVRLPPLPRPDVQSVVVNDGAAQRSLVTSLTVTFSTVVTLDPGAFDVERQGGQSFQLDVAMTVVGNQTVAEVTFSGAQIINGSLPDGDYTLTVRADHVHDSSGQGLGADNVTTFFRLFGDSNGNGVIDFDDLLHFISTFGKRAGDPGYLAYFDYYGDGRVDFDDLVQLLLRLGRRV
jgi:probable HAF family extracellular repeat protein